GGGVRGRAAGGRRARRQGPAGERGARGGDRRHALLLGPRGLRGRLHARRAQPARTTERLGGQRRPPGGTIAACATFLLIAREDEGGSCSTPRTSSTASSAARSADAGSPGPAPAAPCAEGGS